MTLLKQKLLEWNYYFYKIPLYLQESLPGDNPQLGIGGHMKMFFDILVNSNEEGSKILDAFNITDPDYFENLDLTGVTANGTEFELLDKLAELYGFTRKMKVNDNDITLTNKQLIQLLEIKIFQINWEGTRDEYLKLYETINLPISFYLDKYIPGKIITTIDESTMESNMKILYQNTNLLFIDLLGVQYERFSGSIPQNVGLFDVSKFNAGAKFL